MKIIEAQSALLSNAEVYQFLKDQAAQYGKEKRRGPPNLETMRRELIQYFEAHPNPLSQKPSAYSDDGKIRELIERLHDYNITKGEMLMIINTRPTNVAVLNTVIEDMESRFASEQQEAIVSAIVETLGEFPRAEEADEGEEMEGAENGR